MDSLNGKKLINTKGRIFKADKVLKDSELIVYYFSASWCNHNVTEPFDKIKELHEESKRRNIRLDIVYVPMDVDKNEMVSHFNSHHGDWYALPYGDPTIEELRVKYSVTHIPTIIVVKLDGFVVSSTGLQELQNIGLNVLVTWTDWPI